MRWVGGVTWHPDGFGGEVGVVAIQTGRERRENIVHQGSVCPLQLFYLLIDSSSTVHINPTQGRRGLNSHLPSGRGRVYQQIYNGLLQTYILPPLFTEYSLPKLQQ